MKLLFLIATTYLIIEYLSYLKRKEIKEEQAQNGLEKVVDKATQSIKQVVDEAKENLGTPAKKSVVDIQSLDTVLPSSKKVELVEDEPRVEDLGFGLDPAIAFQSKISCELQEHDSEELVEPTIQEVQSFIDDSEVLVEDTCMAARDNGKK